MTEYILNTLTPAAVESLLGQFGESEGLLNAVSAEERVALIADAVDVTYTGMRLVARMHDIATRIVSKNTRTP